MKIVKVNKQEPYYSYCLEGKKKIEGRLNKGKFSTIEVGDILRANNSISFEVIGRKIYKSFREMIIEEGVENVTPDKGTVEDAVNVYYQFYTSEQEKEFGVVALKIKKIN